MQWIIFGFIVLIASNNAAQGKTHVVDIKFNKFFSDQINIEVGDTVEWTNHSTFLHAVNTDPSLTDEKDRINIPARAVPFYSGVLTNGDSYSYTFFFPGKYYYMCTFHKEMNGLIVVNDTGQISH